MGKYRVIGRYAVFGNKPGSTFEREIPADHEARLIKAGHIKPVKAPEKKKENSDG